MGIWVRVGDPNQSIMSTFTAAHPRFFNDFVDSDDVVTLPLPNSGRSSPKIIGAANSMVDWTIEQHPVPEVREHAFRRQHILPTPPGDAQPNPPDTESAIKIKVYANKEDEELPSVANLAARYAKENPQHTLAILVPTNDSGYHVATHLDSLEVPYDNLLRGGTREREIASAINAVLTVLADPQDQRAAATSLESLHQLGHRAASFPGEALPHLVTILKSVQKSESLLFPANDGRVEKGAAVRRRQ